MFPGPVLTLDGTYMKQMKSYMIWLRVTKPDRVPAKVMYDLKVLTGIPPTVSIQ